MHSVAEQSTRVVESVDRALRLLQGSPSMGRASHSVSWRRRRDCRRARCIERSGRCRSVASRPSETMRATCWGRSCSGSRSSSTAASICGAVATDARARTCDPERDVHVGYSTARTSSTWTSSNPPGRSPSRRRSGTQSRTCHGGREGAAGVGLCGVDHRVGPSRRPLVRRTSAPSSREPPREGVVAFRADGFSKDLEESEPGVRCLATPVFFGGAVPIAAISVSAPKDRLPTGMMPEVAALLVQEVADLLAPSWPRRGPGSPVGRCPPDLRHVVGEIEAADRPSPLRGGSSIEYGKCSSAVSRKRKWIS